MHGNHAWAYISVSDDGGTFASAVKGSITSAVTRTDLSEHVKVAPRALPGEWPQSDSGVVLWALSAVAGEWQGTEARTALCAVPDDTVSDVH